MAVDTLFWRRRPGRPPGPPPQGRSGLTTPPVNPPKEPRENGQTGAEKFHVFLSYNRDDRQDVSWVYGRLRARDILPWLDLVNLRPGFPWQPELERQIEHIEAAAVFVGPSGIGPWQDEEIHAYLSAFIQRQCPVIPVLLPGAPDTLTLPLFLRARTWVDLRRKDEVEIDRLVWGITGRRPLAAGP